jgi:hypothetical protein
MHRYKIKDRNIVVREVKVYKKKRGGGRLLSAEVDKIN